MKKPQLLPCQPGVAQRRLARWLLHAVSLMALALFTSGCTSLFGANSPEPTALPAIARQMAPTFTPTPLVQVAAPTPPPTPAATVSTPSTASNTPLTTTTAMTNDPAPTETPTAAPRLSIAGDLVNLRSGPGTGYDLVGTAGKGQIFDLVARNAQGDWWQVCCVDGQPGWVFGELALVENAEALPLAGQSESISLSASPESPGEETPVQPTPTETPAPLSVPAPPAAAPDPGASSAGFFDPNAQYQIVHFKVLGLDENNGGIRDSSAQHLIFLTVLDANGNGVDGAVVRNLVGDKSEVTTGAKGPGKAEITMYYEPFKLAVVSDPSGPATSQVSNQMGLAFPHLPDLVGKLGDVNYEYGACPTLEIRCQWPIQAIHFSYEITFQKVK